MTRVLVTGGCGFLGTRVCRALARHPAVTDVVAADVREPVSQDRGVRFVRCDVTDAPAVTALMRDEHPDVVVHLASVVNPGRDEKAAYRVDVGGAANVVDACVAAGVRRIVVSSSGAAYGYRADNPVPLRETDPLRGNDALSCSHHPRIVEEMLAEARVRHPALEQVVFRIGTILGPTVDNQITALWAGRRILHVRGSDSPFVFVWVDDVAAAMVRAATDGAAGVFNVAGSGQVTVPDIARRLRKPMSTMPAGVLRFALWVGHGLRLTVHGPEWVCFLRYRPVLADDALIDEFGYTPAKTSASAFEAYVQSHPQLVRR